MGRKPKLGVFKFASCDGCQLSLLDAEADLLSVAAAVDIAYFLEATSRIEPGPYDVAIVEGSVTTEHDRERIQRIRKGINAADDDRRLRHGRWNPGAAQLGGPR